MEELLPLNLWQKVNNWSPILNYMVIKEGSCKAYLMYRCDAVKEVGSSIETALGWVSLSPRERVNHIYLYKFQQLQPLAAAASDYSASQRLILCGKIEKRVWDGNLGCRIWEIIQLQEYIYFQHLVRHSGIEYYCSWKQVCSRYS